MDIDIILTAHDYHPCGRIYSGRAKTEAALDACLEPFDVIERLVAGAPDADDEALCEEYNSLGSRPRLGAHVIRKYRESIKS